MCIRDSNRIGALGHRRLAERFYSKASEHLRNAVRFATVAIFASSAGCGGQSGIGLSEERSHVVSIPSATARGYLVVRARGDERLRLVMYVGDDHDRLATYFSHFSPDSGDELVAFLAVKGGTSYRFELSRAAGSSDGPVPAHTFETEVVAIDDPFEPNDDPSSAKDLTRGEARAFLTTEHHVRILPENAYDDWYRLAVDPKGMEVRVDSPEETTMRLEAYKADGRTRIASSFKKENAGSVSIVIPPLGSEPALIRVAGTTDSHGTGPLPPAATIPYALRATPLPQ